jgi:TetR/AcrR family transcriptional regulator, transcriptional repressor for nem operon
VRYAADQKAKTRARIVAAAGRVFRREGYHAAGVDKVMAEAGLTAGGFYAHFDSKQALLAEALEHAAAEIDERFARSTENLSGREWVEAFLGRYLSLEHCRGIDDGCPLAALVSEVARADAAVKERFEAIVRELVTEVASQSRACGSTRCDALAVVAMCLGGLGLARSVRDRGYAEQILKSCSKMAAEILGASETRTGAARSRRKSSGS